MITSLRRLIPSSPVSPSWVLLLKLLRHRRLPQQPQTEPDLIISGKHLPPENEQVDAFCTSGLVRRIDLHHLSCFNIIITTCSLSRALVLEFIHCPTPIQEDDA